MKKEGQDRTHNWHVPPCKHHSFNRTVEESHGFPGVMGKSEFHFPETIPKGRPEQRAGETFPRVVFRGLRHFPVSVHSSLVTEHEQSDPTPEGPNVRRSQHEEMAHGVGRWLQVAALLHINQDPGRLLRLFSNL